MPGATMVSRLDWNQTTTPTLMVVYSKLIDDDVAYVIQILIYVVFVGIVSIIGMVANVLNIITFIKQGVFKDSCTMGLLGLAISDFFCVLTLFWFAIITMVVFEEPPGLNWDPSSIMFNTAGRPHVIFSQVTCWITSYISFERCVCVLFPFKAKLLFTAKKTMIIIPFIFATTFLLNTPLYMREQLQWLWTPELNMTKLRLVATSLVTFEVITVFNYLNPVVLKFTSVFSVIVFNIIITWRVKLSTKWRSQTTSSVGENKKSGRKSAEQPKVDDEKSFQKERNMIKMITMISLVFTICYTPDIAVTMCTMLEWKINHLNPWHNLFHVLHCISFFVESINSSVNIIIYYRMSTRFREEFRRLMKMK